MPPRRKCLFNADLAKHYPFIKSIPNKTASDVCCTVCNAEFSIANSGRSDIEKHLQKERHVKALRAKSNQPQLRFEKPIDCVSLANEGVWSYHVVKSNQSFRSTDCASKIFRKCFGLKDFKCARTKTEAIITNVFGPLAKNMLKEELSKSRYVTLSIDASNHGNLKMMPIIARFFIPTVGTHVKVLDLATVKDETSETVCNLLVGTAIKNDIEDKFAGFGGDNCPANFGSCERGGQRNVLHRLKIRNPSMVGIGCAAHIAHNTLKFALDQLPFDIENIVVKIYSTFYINTIQVEALRSLCDSFEGVEFSKLLGYAKTRFLALCPAVKRILELYDPLKTYFLALTKCPAQLKTFFESPISRLCLLFIKEQVNNA